MDWELACHEILISRSASVVLSSPKFESTGKTFLLTAEAIYSNKVFKLLKRHVPANIFKFCHIDSVQLAFILSFLPS